MTKKLIGILGGSFNPPHMGHLKMAEYAYEKLGLDQVWLLVSPQNPIKPREEMAPFEDRLNMTQVLASQHDWLMASDKEIHLGTTKTFETLTKLQDKFPDYRFVWLIGEDNFIGFDKWYHWQELLDQFSFGVFMRPGEMDKLLTSAAAKYAPEKRQDFDSIKENDGWVFLDNEPIHCSSTDIRQALHHGQPPKLLCTDVFEYIKTHHLYRED